MSDEHSNDSQADEVGGSKLLEVPKYPVACPHGMAHSGYPYHVQTSRESHDSLTMSVRCRDCEHSWIQQAIGHDGPPA